jgi:hypothetical protein
MSRITWNAKALYITSTCATSFPRALILAIRGNTGPLLKILSSDANIVGVSPEAIKIFASPVNCNY